MKYKIYECETLMGKNSGKEFKKLVLKAEGQENTEPRVTLWDNHPQYAEAKSGGTINGTLEKKDSGTPIPAHPEKNYINRTLLAGGTEKTSPAPAPASDHDLVARVIKLEAKVFGETNSDGSPTPNFEPEDDIPY